MNDPIPPSDPAAPAPADSTPPAKKVRRHNWHRIRVYIFSILLIMSMWGCGVVITVRYNPKRIVDTMLAQLPFSSSTGNVFWINRRTLEIDNITVGKFFSAESVILTASPYGLWRHHIAKIQILGAAISAKEAEAVMDSSGPMSSTLDWVIGRLEISRSTIDLDNLVADTSLPIPLGVKQPIVIHALSLAEPNSDPRMKEEQDIEIDDVKLGNFFNANSIIVTASPWGLFHHKITRIQLIGGQVFTKALFAAIDKTPPSQGKPLDWVINRLEISRGMVLLDNLLDSTAIPLRLGVREPIVLRALRLGEPDASPEMNEEQSVEIGTVSITSPVDPVVPVFYFPLTRLRFTYAEIWHHHIRGIDMIRPTMFLGQDLFWLVQQFKAASPTAPSKGVDAPWYVDRFEVQFGRLAVNAFGQPVIHFPFYFDTKVDDIRLDQLDKISAKATVPIRNFTQDYPDYKVNVVNLSGRLYFSWPPSDTKANNVVNTIHVDEVSWNGIPAKDIGTTVTFDPNGVYGKLYGTCEGGQLSGNFEFYYTKGFTWNADFFANKINCQPITEKLIGKYANLTGELDGDLDIQGQATDILHCGGLLELPNPGRLDIKSMDDLVDRIPKDMITVKRDAIKIAIDAFKNYPYDKGTLRLEYKPTGGDSTLRLEGPLGTRQFDIVLHPYNLTDDKTPTEAVAH